MTEGICKRCKNERKSATEGSDYLCDGCFDYLSGVSPYDPMTPNPMLDAVQAMLDDDDDEGYEDPEDYDDYWSDYDSDDEYDDLGFRWGDDEEFEDDEDGQCEAHYWETVICELVDFEEFDDGDEGDSISYEVWKNTYQCLKCGEVVSYLSSNP